MGLSIDGNEVHGFAKGGQAFVPASTIPKENSNGSITYNGQNYINLTNASFNVTQADYNTWNVVYGSDINATFNNVPSYSLYQIKLLGQGEYNIQLDVVSAVFTIDSDTTITVPTSDKSLSIQVFVSDSGLNFSFENSYSNMNSLTGTLLGFSIN